MNEVEEVKARLDIVDVIGQYIQLQKAGRRFKAPCPFHTERTPSFIVTPDRQTWHCFGACGTGGDVITFVMKKDGLEFADALRLLAERAGIQLRERRVSEKVEREHERLYAANEAAAQWFRHLLAGEAGRQTRVYLERRGVDETTAQAFLLGYSAPAWEATREHLREHGFSDAELLSAGLLIEGESNPYDRFRGRLMFPIRDVKGRVIGFGARALDDSLPKYLNTAQAVIFDKGSVLYALDQAQAGIRRESRAVIVEGYMDAIAAHQHGFDNVVASMGTALTERQVRMVRKLAPEIVLALDADAAGSQAAVRGDEVVLGSDPDTVVPVPDWRGVVRYQQIVAVELRVAVLPEGQDPDDVIRADPEAWRGLITGATPVLDYRLGASAAAHDLSSPRGRSQLAHEYLPLLTAVTDPVIRAHYLQRLSRLTLTDERELSTMLTRTKVRGQPASTASAQSTGPSRSDTLEEFLLSLLLRYPDLREDGLETPETLLWESENQELLVAWKVAATGEVEYSLEAVKEAISLELQPHLERLTLRSLLPFEAKEAQEAFRDCRERLRRRVVEAEKQAISAMLAAREEELGAGALAEAAQAETVDDERMKEALGLLVRDTETGLRLHGTRTDG